MYNLPTAQFKALKTAKNGKHARERNNKDFDRNMGKEVEVKLYKMVDKRKDYEGELKAYDKNTVTIIEDGNEIVLERDNIALVRLAIHF